MSPQGQTGNEIRTFYDGGVYIYFLYIWQILQGRTTGTNYWDYWDQLGPRWKHDRATKYMGWQNRLSRATPLWKGNRLREIQIVNDYIKWDLMGSSTLGDLRERRM